MGDKAGIEELKEIFNAADKDKSGSLCRDELKEVLCKGNRKITESQLDEVFCYFDDGTGGDKRITLDEFIKGLQKLFDFVEELKELFKQFDTDNSGCLDRNELKKVLSECGHQFTESEIDDILREVDPNGDKKVSCEEFLCFFS
ncbi:hypothetical protein BsWGS_05407 [Bradybaena similaris]